MYNVRSLRNHSLRGADYLIDTNVWIHALDPSPVGTKDAKMYVDFVSSFLSCQLPEPPRIVFTQLLFSELINTFIFKHKFPEWKTKQKIVTPDFKKTYRKSNEYLADLQTLYDDLLVYEKNIKFIDSNMSTESFIKILENPTSDMDINDSFLIETCATNGLVFLTNDNDFFHPGIEIITLNKDLIEKANLHTAKHLAVPSIVKNPQ